MRQQARTGFSLVEVLVSLFILSFGVIGAASMQLTALRTTQQASFHGIALQLATDVADQVRMFAGSSISDAANPLLAFDFKSGEKILPPSALCYGAASGCDELSLAEFGIYEVQKRIEGLLPQGRIKVCRDAMPWNGSAGAYNWECVATSGRCASRCQARLACAT